MAIAGPYGTAKPRRPSFRHSYRRLVTFEGQAINAPAGLSTDEFILRPIVAADAALDYEAVMETRVFLRRWEREPWPEDDFTVEDNRGDMVKMQDRHNRGESFGYTVMDPGETTCLGCVYVFHPSARWYQGAKPAALGKAEWATTDAMISYWVRQSQMEAGLDLRLLQALIPWFTNEWGFTAPMFMTNPTLAEQVAALDATELEPQFDIVLPDGAIDGEIVNDLAYGSA